MVNLEVYNYDIASRIIYESVQFAAGRYKNMAFVFEKRKHIYPIISLFKYQLERLAVVHELDNSLLEIRYKGSKITFLDGSYHPSDPHYLRFAAQVFDTVFIQEKCPYLGDTLWKAPAYLVGVLERRCKLQNKYVKQK